MHSCLLLYPSGQPLIPRCCLNRTLFCLDCAFAITHEMKLWEDQVSGLLLNCRLSLAPGRVPPLCQLCTPSSAAKICLRVDPKLPGGDFPGAQVIRPLLFHSSRSSARGMGSIPVRELKSCMTCSQKKSPPLHTNGLKLVHTPPRCSPLTQNHCAAQNTHTHTHTHTYIL